MLDVAKKDNGASADAAQARADEQARQQTIRDGTTRIDNIFNGQFNDDFYNGRQKAYTDFAQPEVDRQFGEANKQLTYGLARSGTLDSSDRAKEQSELQRQYDVNKQSVSDQGLSYATNARNSVEDARANLITTLNATGDAEGAANSAITRASALSAPAAFSPIGQLFSTATGALATQANAERTNALSGGLYPSTYNTGLFGNSGAVKVSQ